jgi:hypothetical protein
MKYICLVYLVEKDMRAMTKREADAWTHESLPTMRPFEKPAI